MDGNREALLLRMEKGLRRMESRGSSEVNSEDYANFKRKYEAIKRGADYTTRNVAPEMIAAYAAQIPRVNSGANGLITPRGNVQEVVEGASDFVKKVTEHTDGLEGD